MTIFGEEHFFDKLMVEVYESTNKYVYDKFSGAVKVAMPHVEIDEERLKRWINLCLKLDDIDKSDLIDMATRKKFMEQQDTINKLKREIETLKEVNIRLLNR